MLPPIKTREKMRADTAMDCILLDCGYLPSSKATLAKNAELNFVILKKGKNK